MKLQKVIPAAYRLGPTFAMRARGCTLEDIRMPVYHVSVQAKGFRAARRAARVGIGDAAAKLGISAIELSGLESGKYRLEDPKDWARMEEVALLTIAR